DALRTRRLQLLAQVACLVVDAGVEAELVLDVGTFLAATGDAHRARAPDFRELSDDAADRARRRGYHQRVARPGLAELLQAEVRRHARHADEAEVIAERRARRVDSGRFPGAAIELPAELCQDHVADLELRVARFQHLAGALADHD